MSNFRRNLISPNNKEEYKVSFYAVVNEYSKILYDFNTDLYSYGIGFTLSIDDWADSSAEAETATPVYPCTLEVIIKNKQKDTIVDYKKTLSEIDKLYFKDGTQNRVSLDSSSVSEYYAWELPYGNYFVEIVISSQKILFKDKANLNQKIPRYSSYIKLSNFTFTFRGDGDKNPEKKRVTGYCFKHLISNNRSNKSKFNFLLTKPPLPAPTNLTLAEDGTLSWDAVENAESYVIQITDLFLFGQGTIYKEIKTNNTSENIKDYLLKWEYATTYYVRVYGVPKANSIYINGEQASTSYTVS